MKDVFCFGYQVNWRVQVRSGAKAEHSLQSEREISLEDLPRHQCWDRQTLPVVVKVQLSKALLTPKPCRLLLELGNGTWRISLVLQEGYGSWLLGLQLAGVLESKVQERKHPREPRKHCQSEISKKLRVSINSVTCQVQLWSVWSLQIKEQASACYTLTASKLKKREPTLYKMNFYLPRFGKVFHLAVL